MFKNYIKTAWRNMRRNKGNAVINIAGLGVGLACFVLILLYTGYEFSFEQHNPNAGRVYRIYVEHEKPDRVYRVASTPVPLVEALEKEIPEIEAFTRYQYLPNLAVKYGDNNFVERQMVAVDPGVFDTLGFRLIAGDPATALQDMYTAVVTQDIARKYFGDADPLGKTLTVDNSISFMIRGIMRNHPANSDFTPDILISFASIKEMYGPGYATNWLSQVLQSFVLLPPQHSVPVLEEKIAACFEKYRARENDLRTFRLENLGRMHLFSIFGDRRITTVSIFLGVGILILLMACINFMNLATARSAKRAREVAMRKVAGAKRNQIIAQFLGESFVYVFLAFLLALLLSAALLPLLRNITGQPLVMAGILQAPLPVVLLSAWLVVGFLSGSYPAFYLSAFRPAGIFQGAAGSSRKGAGFRRILVVFQFTISIILIAATFAIIHQINYMAGKSLGFRKNQILVLRTPPRRSIQPFKVMLQDNPDILSVTGSAMLPHSIGRYNTVTWEGAVADESVTIIHNTVDHDFLKTFEIPLVQGRDFSREFPSDVQVGSRRSDDAGAVIINETAARRFGWKNPIGKKVIQTYGELRIYYTVIGVIKDFHFTSLRNPIVPLKIFVRPDLNANYISIKVRPENIPHTLETIQFTWTQFNPGYPFEYFFYDSVFERRFQQERSLLILFQYFSFLAIFIACLGLFGLASFAAEQRTKEIGIRKILGATSRGLVLLLGGQFSRWVLIANLIAWPLAYVGVSRWLAGYAYHASMRLDALFWSGLLVLAIALLTVSFQAFKAARANPADSLRYE